MKTIKILVSVLAFGILLSNSTFAIHPPRHHRRFDDSTKPEEKAEIMTVKMKYYLDLNAEQEAKVKAINIKYAKQMKDYLDANKKQMEAFQKGMENIDTEKDKELGTVLKPEQVTKYKAKKEEREKHHSHGKKRRWGK